MSNTIDKPNLITDKAKLGEHLTTRKNITTIRHNIATLIQLDHIVFRINELNDIAIYKPENNTLVRKDIKELVEPYIFPVLSNSTDDKKIKEYFDIIYFDEFKNYNKRAFTHVRALKISIGMKEDTLKKIVCQKGKQKELREFYNEQIKGVSK